MSINDLSSLSINILGTFSKLNSLSVLLVISTGLPQVKSLMGLALVFKRFATDEKYLQKMLALLYSVMSKVLSFVMVPMKRNLNLYFS